MKKYLSLIIAVLILLPCIARGQKDPAASPVPGAEQGGIDDPAASEAETQQKTLEFAEAGASSLDLVVIADFKGSQAPIYNRLKRSIQRWCVDAASQYNWDIPFPQLTVHREI